MTSVQAAQGVDGLEQRGASEDSPGLLSDEHVVVAGRALDRSGDMHGVARDRWPSRAGDADDDLARLDARTDRPDGSRFGSAAHASDLLA
ncbi:MAG: hypothetical protein ACRDF0_07405, partial [Candidatus Limnocylindria bacterium]